MARAGATQRIVRNATCENSPYLDGFGDIENAFKVLVVHGSHPNGCQSEVGSLQSHMNQDAYAILFAEREILATKTLGVMDSALCRVVADDEINGRAISIPNPGIQFLKVFVSLDDIDTLRLVVACGRGEPACFNDGLDLVVRWFLGGETTT